MTGEPTATDWAYLAGLFDGEGCVMIHHNGTGTRHHVLRIAIANTHHGGLSWVKERFPGASLRGVGGKPEHKPGFRIDFNGRDAEKILRGMLPYLIIRREQALIGLEFISTIGPQGRPLSPEVIEQRTACYDRLRVLNRRGVA